MTVDVVMLSNTLDDAIYQMTKEAINSLGQYNDGIRFNVILVETQTAKHVVENDFLYGNSVTVVYLNARPFNYNEALNIGFTHLSGAEYVVICNNDLVFGRNWFHELRRDMEDFNLDVASPVSPGWPPHEELCAKTISTTFFGTRTSYEFCGWCFCIRRKALDAIRPLDERFKFEWQDVDMVEQLKRAGHGKMALVRYSEVKHLLNQSHRLIENRHGMIEGADEIYREKYGQ